MGLFKNLFGKKDAFGLVKNNARRAGKSFNYNYVFLGLKTVYFEVECMDNLYNNEQNTEAFLKKCADAVKDVKKIKIDERYLNLKYYFGKGKESRAIIIELPGPYKNECECNYVALAELNGKKCIYTSEYYSSDNSFGLCMENSLAHYSLDGTPASLNDFCDLIGYKINT